jgi:hypothetical protein
MAELQCREEPRPELDHALKLMRQAIAALDAGGAPADVGARLDQAINRLEQIIAGQSGG